MKFTPPGTLDVRFVAVDRDNLRFEIGLRIVASEAPPGQPLVVQRLRPDGRPAKVRRLAHLALPDQGFTEIAAAPADSDTSLFIELGEPTAGSPGNWHWKVILETTAGNGAFLRVRHAECADAKLAISVPPKQKNTATPVRNELHREQFPRLVVALNDAPVAVLAQHRPAADPGFGAVADLASVLAHVEARLLTPSSAGAPDLRPDALEDAWRSETKTALLPRAPKPDGHVALAEEVWARQVSEMLDVTPYGGPGVTYVGSASLDAELLIDRVDGTRRDPAYSLIYACQHLATFGVASRARSAHGFPKDGKSRAAISAGSASAALVRKMKGQWIIGGKPPTPVDASTTAIGPDLLKCDPSLTTAAKLFEIHDMEGCEFGPGSVFVFANRGVKADGFDHVKNTTTVLDGDMEVTFEPGGELGKDGKTRVTKVQVWRVNGKLLADNTASAHAAFVLRSDPQLKLFQPLDTGGLVVANRGAGVTLLKPSKPGFHTGNFDDPAAQKISGGDPFRGVGVWTRPTAKEADELAEHVENVLKKARPLGLARVLLVKASTKFTPNGLGAAIDAGDVLFASPVVRMYRDDPLQNHSIARFVWAMRGAPVGGAKALCWLSIPTGPLALAMLEGGRTAKLGELARKAFDTIKNPKTRKKLQEHPGQLVARMLGAYTLPIIDMEVHGDDKVRVTYKYSKLADMHSLHFAERAAWDGRVRLPMDAPFVVGGQSPAGFPAYFMQP
ncbi:MAG: hypothetical protein IAG13_32085 [Deltaproteobacteria bacterium]|nr:hypothetical protein [Nannocystaceae bacterium]